MFLLIVKCNSGAIKNHINDCIEAFNSFTVGKDHFASASLDYFDEKEVFGSCLYTAFISFKYFPNEINAIQLESIFSSKVQGLIRPTDNVYIREYLYRFFQQLKKFTFKYKSARISYFEISYEKNGVNTKMDFNKLSNSNKKITNGISTYKSSYFNQNLADYIDESFNLK